MAACEIQSAQDGSIELIGALDAMTVPNAWKSLEAKLQQSVSDTITLNLEKLSSIDTAGLACLVNCSVNCQKQGKTLQLLNVPGNINKLAKISDVEGILALQ